MVAMEERDQDSDDHPHCRTCRARADYDPGFYTPETTYMWFERVVIFF